MSCLISPLFSSLTTVLSVLFFFFFFNDTATTEIYTLSLHDALPICVGLAAETVDLRPAGDARQHVVAAGIERDLLLVFAVVRRSEEHTSELQSQSKLVCRLLLEKKKKKIKDIIN